MSNLDVQKLLRRIKHEALPGKSISPKIMQGIERVLIDETTERPPWWQAAHDFVNQCKEEWEWDEVQQRVNEIFSTLHAAGATVQSMDIKHKIADILSVEFHSFFQETTDAD